MTTQSPAIKQTTYIQSPNIRLLSALFATYVFWGGTYLALRVAVQTLPPLMMSGVRFIFAGIVLLSILKVQGHTFPTRIQWRNTFIVGAIMLIGGMGSVAVAEQWVESGLAALAVAVIPLWITVIAIFIERTYPSRRQVIGLGLGLIGILILNLGADFSAEPEGAFLLFIAPILWATGSIMTRHLDMPKGLMNSASTMLGGGIALLIFGMAIGEPLPTEFALDAVLSWLYLVIFGSILAFTAYSYLLKNASPTVATSYAYVNPVLAVFFGWLLLSESLTPQTLVSAAIILPSVVLITTGQKKKQVS